MPSNRRSSTSESRRVSSRVSPGRRRIPIFLKDADGRYRFVNDGAARGMGGGTVEEYVGRTDAEIFSAEQLPAIRRDDDAVRAGGVALDFEEAVGDRRFLVTKSPYTFGDGSVGILGVARDITDRVRSEARIASLAILGQAVGRESTVAGVARAAVEPLRAATGGRHRLDLPRRRHRHPARARHRPRHAPRAPGPVGLRRRRRGRRTPRRRSGTRRCGW